MKNMEFATDKSRWPAHRAAIERALAFDAAGTKGLRLREEAMLLMREFLNREERILEFTDAGMLRPIDQSLQVGDERVISACLAVIRAFAFSDDLKEKLA